MRGLSIFLFFELCLISNVFSIPIPGALKIMSSYDPTNNAVVHQNKDRVAALRKANKEANSQYKHMERVLADPTKPEHAAAISKAFGDNPNLDAIKANVKTLKAKTLLVKNVEEPFNPAKPNNVAFARTHPNGKKTLHFGDKFFNSKTPKGQAGTLIHEGSHALFNTYDNFVHTGPGQLKAVSKGEAKKSTGPVHSGYLHKDYQKIKTDASHLMHQNADSYKAFGHYAKYGANTPMDHKKSTQSSGKGRSSRSPSQGGGPTAGSSKRRASRSPSPSARRAKRPAIGGSKPAGKP